MSNAAIFIFFLTNPLKWRNEQVTLNQRVPGSSPGAPTIDFTRLSSLHNKSI
jgi:hypothetical protein